MKFILTVKNLKMSQLSKGDLMTMVYGEGYSNIDSAIPQALWEQVNTRIHVMNYNNFGQLENLMLLAIKKELDIDYKEEYIKCCASNSYYYNNYLREVGMPFWTPEVFKAYKKKLSMKEGKTFLQLCDEYFDKNNILWK